MSKTQRRREASARRQAELASELYDPKMLIASIRCYVEVLGSGAQVDCFKNPGGSCWRPHLAAARRLLSVRVTKDVVLNKCRYSLPEGFEKRIQERLTIDIKDAAFHKLAPNGDIDDTLRHYVAAIGAESTAGENHPTIVLAKQVLLEPATRIAARKAKADAKAQMIII